MAGEHAHHRTYSVGVAAPAGTVCAPLADTTRRPLFPRSCSQAERLDFDGVHDLLRAWTELHGSVRPRPVRRTLDAVARRSDFRQEAAPAGPLLARAGSRRVEAGAPGRRRLALDHDVTPAQDVSQDADTALRAAGARSAAEPARLRVTAEHGDRLEHPLPFFEESVHTKGPAEPVHSFLCSLTGRPGRVAHVLRAEVAEDRPGAQAVRTETRCGGLVRSTGTARVRFPHALRITAEETAPQEPFQAHTSEWPVLSGERDVTVPTRHRVLRREDRAVSTAAARAAARDLPGGQRKTVPDLAGRHAEPAVRTR
ncbi:cyclase [Streptomyces sp. NPDC047017]|uniref:cyclase n=1 Tax=Streptomyces sp. NPDC047017 TaxID=3155024 RepID=UPI003403EB4F